MATLLSFILNTLQPRLNNPKNKNLWAPKLLSTANDGNGKRLLPLTSASEDLGTLTGSEADQLATTLAQDWSISTHLKGEFGIPNPADPDPHLSMSNVVLMGVDNLKIQDVQSQPAADGYSMTLTAVFNAYPTITDVPDNTVNGVLMTDLYLQGKWNASQAVCSCATIDGTTCDGKFQDNMVGSGDFKMVFSGAGAQIDATVKVNGSGVQRTLAINITSVQIVGPSLTPDGTMPSYTIPYLTLDQKIGSQKYTDATINDFRQALESSECQPIIFAKLNSLLTAPDTLTTLNNTVQTLANNLLDGAFGPVPGGGLPNDAGNQHASTPVDLYVFDRVRVGVENPNSNLYAPLLVDMNSDPVLEPWKSDKIVIPPQDIAGITTDITLTNVVVTGISNIDIPVAQAILQGAHIQSEIQIGTLPAGPNRNVNQGGNTVNMAVPVAPPSGLQCGFSWEQEGTTYNGNLTLAMSGLTGQVQIQLTGADIDTFAMTVQALTLDTTDASAIATVTTTPDDKLTDAFLKSIFESKKILAAVTKAVNDDLTGQLASISTDITTTLRNTLAEVLGP